MSANLNSTVRQRSEYTFRHNDKMGRFGWLRLTPAYSVKVVEEIIDLRKDAPHVLDPFAGTSTTALCAAYRNLDAVTVEINPFSVWLGAAKTCIYAKKDLSDARQAGKAAQAIAAKKSSPAAEAPKIHNIERW